VIVIVGALAWRAAPSAAPAGRACGIALAAAGRGASVELVGRVGEDQAGEDLLIALAKAGVGHAAVLRDPARPTPVLPALAPPSQDDDEAVRLDEPMPVESPPAVAAGPRLDGADIDLAVKYLAPTGVMVVADDVPAHVLAAAVDAGTYAETRLVVLLPPGALAAGSVPVGLPEDATVLAAPDAGADETGAFEVLVGAYAAALDGGADPAAAFAAAQGSTGWEAAEPA
jgi:hypothetical protein